MVEVSEAYLREYLLRNYVEIDGRLLRRFSYKQWKAGTVVGTVSVRGYRTLSVLGTRYPLHRLVWLWHYGKFPTMVDHIDGDKTNNNIDNLRETTQTKNAFNLHKAHKDSATGILGVCWDKSSGKFLARVGGKHLGRFNSIEEAASVYNKAKLARLAELA